MPNVDEPFIEYPVRDLLERMQKDMTTTLARIETKLDNKADKSDVATLKANQDHLNGRVDRLEHKEATRLALAQQGDKSAERRLAWLAMVAIILSGAIGAIITLLVT